MKRIAAFCLSLIACAPMTPISPPKPVSLVSPLSPAQVVQRAAQRAVMEGFVVTTSDASGGILTATLTKQGGGAWGPHIVCRFGDSSIDHNAGTAVLTLRLTARSTASGSSVYLATSTATSIDAGIASRRSDDDCTSTGVIEKQITDALAML